MILYDIQYIIDYKFINLVDVVNKLCLWGPCGVDKRIKTDIVLITPDFLVPTLPPAAR